MPLVDATEIEFQERVFVDVSVINFYDVFKQCYADIKFPEKIELNKDGVLYLSNLKGYSSNKRIKLDICFIKVEEGVSVRGILKYPASKFCVILGIITLPFGFGLGWLGFCYLLDIIAPKPDEGITILKQSIRDSEILISKKIAKLSGGYVHEESIEKLEEKPSEKEEAENLPDNKIKEKIEFFDFKISGRNVLMSIGCLLLIFLLISSFSNTSKTVTLPESPDHSFEQHSSQDPVEKPQRIDHTPDQSTGLISITNDPAQSESKSEPTPNTDGDGSDFYAVTGVASADTLNIREQPDSKSAKIGEASYNAIGLRNLGCNDIPLAEWIKMSEENRKIAMSQRWCKIEYRNITGWVHGKYLKEE